MNSLQKLSDQELLQKIIETDKQETEITAEILLFLAEVDRRKIYLQEGYTRRKLKCPTGLSICLEGRAKSWPEPG